jgi:hypothetical protein
MIAYIGAVAAAAILSPIAGFFGDLTWFSLGGGPNASDRAGTVIGFIVFCLIVWGSAPLFRKGLESLQRRISEPVFSCVEFGVAGASLVAGLFGFTELYLGHMRPVGWELVGLVIASVAFVVCAQIGWHVGTNRKGRSVQAGGG